MLRFALALTLLTNLAGCAPDPQAEPDPDAELAMAEEAMTSLGRRLLEALTTALDEGGPEAAVGVCRDQAPGIAAAVSSERVRVGRTSHRLRNPENAPPAWAAGIVARSAGAAANSVERHVVDAGDRLGVLAPIGTLGLCTTCHGDADTFPPELRATLAAEYPGDRATGFEIGDLRGWIWAEVLRDR